MRPRTRTEMDEILRTLVRDCLDLMEQANLRKSDLAALLDTSRVTVGRWTAHMEEDGDWETLPVGASTSATIFMNLMIVRRLLELGMASGELPVSGGPGAKRWIRKFTADPTR